MKVGVIADTHLKGSSPRLERVAATVFRDVDLILHAGDLTTLDVLDAFRDKEVIAVAGNSDCRQVKEKLPRERVITTRRIRIGLIHGWGLPLGIGRRAAPLFQDIQCLVYGHSHWPVNRRRDNVLYFNPGAFSCGLPSLWRRSVGLLTIDRGHIQGHIVRL